MEVLKKKLPVGKAIGDDENPTELQPHMGDNGVEILTGIINRCYNTGEMPEDFGMSIFYCQITKVSNTAACSEHRSISLISHASKLL